MPPRAGTPHLAGRPRWVAGVVWLLASLFWGGAAAAPPVGEFQLVRGALRADVKSWGPHCGPRPASSTTGRKGTRYTFEATGNLRASKGARPLFGPGLCRAATAQPRIREARSGATIRCTSSDPARKITGRVRLTTPGPNQINVDERFDYDWTLKGSHCQLTLEGRWRLDRVEPVDRCATPGPAAQLTIAGAARRRVRAGGRVSVSGSMVDANRCPAAGSIAWTASAGRMRGDQLDTHGVPAGTTITVTGQIGALQRSIEVVVVAAPTARRPRAIPTSSTDDLAAQLEGRLADGAGPLPPQAGTGVAGSTDQPADDGALSPLLTALFIGLGLAALAVAGWIAITARRLGRRSPALATRRPPATSEAPRAAPVEPKAPEPDPETELALEGPLRCPRCDRRFEDGSQFCPFDGARLEDDHGDAPQTEVAERPQVCPRCHAQLPASATHCGFDGTPLASAAPGDATAIDLPRIRAHVCPTCGTHYPLDTDFCGLDGTRLILLN